MTRAAGLFAVVLAAGCVSPPEEAHVRWSEAAPVVVPTAPEGLPAPRGWLSVRTSASPPIGAKDETPRASYRRYAVFDVEGQLVYK